MKKWLAVIFLLMMGSSVFAQDDPILPPDEADNLSPLTLLFHPDPVTETFFSPNGTVFVSGTLAGELRVWESAQDRGVLRFMYDAYLPGVTVTAFDAAEDVMLLNTGDGSQIEVLDLESGAVLSRFDEHEAPIVMIQVVDDKVLSRDIFDTLILWDIEAGDNLLQLDAISDFAATDERLVVANREGEISQWELDDLEDPVTLPGRASNLRFSPGGRWLAGWDARVAVWDTNDGEQRFQLPRDVQVDDVLWTPDGRFLITQGFDAAALWAITEIGDDILPGTQVDAFDMLELGIRQIEIAPNGERVATLDTRGTIRLWRVQSDGDVDLVRGLVGVVDRIEISPDSQTLVGFQIDFRTRFYRADSGGLFSETRLPDDAIFSPDWLLAASNEQTIVTWYGLPDNDLSFDYERIGRPSGSAFLRETPSEEQRAILRLDSLESVFAIGRTIDSAWLRAILPDTTQGWIRTDSLVIEGDVAALPVIEVVRIPGNEGQFLLTAIPMDFASFDDALPGCPENWLATVVDRTEVDDAEFVQLDCAGVIGWANTERIRE